MITFLMAAAYAEPNRGEMFVGWFGNPDRAYGYLTFQPALARTSDASFVLPLDFLRLPLIAAVGLVLYGEPIDGWTILGAAVIVGGNYWSVRQEARR